jgi:hypothetical protein
MTVRAGRVAGRRRMTRFADVEERRSGAVFLGVEQVGTVEAVLVRDDPPSR